MITVVINGESKEIKPDMSIVELLAFLKLNSRALAVEVNNELKPRDSHESTLIQEGDVLEIVTLVGGG